MLILKVLLIEQIKVFTLALKVNIFLMDMGKYSEVNAVYETFFGTTAPPARACVQVKGLPMGAQIEIECVAPRTP